jgi:PP-loop superfamily ATP-utilizing enzyme
MIDHNINMAAKPKILKARFNVYKSAVIAFSGGVDSTFLSRTARDFYGDNLLVIWRVLPVKILVLPFLLLKH